MSIQTITTDDLRRMSGKEGLVIMGCGGDLTEWLDGINDTLAKADILRNGSRFRKACSFEYKGLTCMLFPFDDAELNMGKLALWRLQTHEAYGGTWLSDFIPNYLNGYLDAPEIGSEKPDCPLIGQDGNIFNLTGIAARTLRQNGMPDQAKEMTSRIFSAGSYGEALCILSEYVNITDAESAKEPDPGAVRKADMHADLDARTHDDFTPRDEAAEKRNEIPGRQLTPDGKAPVPGRPAHLPENYLLNTELHKEAQTGSYNMLDGRLDDLAPEKPDLTNGQTHDELVELAPETLPDAKESVLDRLKAERPEHEERRPSFSDLERER